MKTYTLTIDNNENLTAIISKNEEDAFVVEYKFKNRKRDIVNFEAYSLAGIKSQIKSHAIVNNYDYTIEKN